MGDPTFSPKLSRSVFDDVYQNKCPDMWKMPVFWEVASLALKEFRQ